jgi:hypothetical protein
VLKTLVTVCIVATVAALVAIGVSVVAQSNRWLADAPDEAARLLRLEQYLRGFDQPMWEVGARYDRVEEALRDGNWALAGYHWEKVKTTIDNGLMKRPARRPNADKVFLGAPWQDLMTALKSENTAAIGPAFERAKAACQACHVAEQVAFMNDQPMFRRPLPTLPPARR